MDLATIIGIVGGMGLIIVSIMLGGSIGAFINIAGLAVVVGGTIAATLIMQRLSVVIGSFKVAMKVLTDKYVPQEKLIKLILHLAQVAKKEGVLALENETIDNTFLKKGITMLVDGMEQEAVVGVLRTELTYLKMRHKRGQNVFKFMTATSPAFGMVGTLIGLVQMLMSLSDPSAIGPAMAVALLTTFYGAVLAFLFFGPMAGKLENKTMEESARLELIIAGLMGIMNGDHPRIIEQQLVSFLDPKQRKGIVSEEKK